MRVNSLTYMAVGLIPGVLDGGRIGSSSGEISSRERFLEVAKGSMVIGVAGLGMGSGAESDMMGTKD